MPRLPVAGNVGNDPQLPVTAEVTGDLLGLISRAEQGHALAPEAERTGRPARQMLGGGLNAQHEREEEQDGNDRRCRAEEHKRRHDREPRPDRADRATSDLLVIIDAVAWIEAREGELRQRQNRRKRQEGRRLRGGWRNRTQGPQRDGRDQHRKTIARQKGERSGGPTQGGPAERLSAHVGRVG